MGVETATNAVPGLLSGLSPWTYALLGVGAMVALIVLALALVELLE